MIKLIEEPAELAVLETFPADNVFAGKLRALYRTYGYGSSSAGYAFRGDFTDLCRFYKQDDNLFMAQIGQDFSIYSEETLLPEEQAEELALYLKVSRARGVFLPYPILRGIVPYIDGEYLYNNVMEYKDFADVMENPYHKKEYVPSPRLDMSPGLDKVYAILKDGFRLEHSPWLTDVSHRVRHGISKVFLYDEASTVTAFYDICGNIFLTQVATEMSRRKEGLATAMLREACKLYKSRGRRIFLICRDTKRGFYIRAGFRKIDEAAQVYRLELDD
ncbi:hypothetical protein FACS189499_02750 [Clostridia bacterium]|nr:hypothetical protein FACS189499_02750 [Clostridia bacterium]